jgi:hypothetical protein
MDENSTAVPHDIINYHLTMYFRHIIGFLKSAQKPKSTTLNKFGSQEDIKLWKCGNMSGTK